MILLFLSYLGGLLTLLSPCILPVLPFIFTRANRPFCKNSLPLLLGMVFTFTVFSTLAVVGGNWVVSVNEWGRWIALIILAAFGLSFIFPQILEQLLTPLARLGARLSRPTHSGEATQTGSFVLGIATGLLWAPCAGPILGLIFTGAAIQGKTLNTALFLFAYALGAATSLALALSGGGKLFQSMRKSFKAEQILKRLIGVAVLVGVIVIGFNWDRTVLTRISRVQTESLEQALIQFLQPRDQFSSTHQSSSAVGEPMPALTGAVSWINSPPLDPNGLKGKVVLVDFWTYSCINCLRTLPFVRAWAEKYKDFGLVVIGVHTPEFAFEKNLANVDKAVKELGITYPVAIDNQYSIWKSFENRYWPAHYFVDRNGIIRDQHFGEGNYEQSERTIQELLGVNSDSSGFVKVTGQGSEASSEVWNLKSPETYLGSTRAERFSATSSLLESKNGTVEVDYTVSPRLALNEWGLTGRWRVGSEDVALKRPGGKITYRFHARDLNLVLGPEQIGKVIRFKVTLDGRPPGQDHGVDIDRDGIGTVKDYRLYQLIRQQPGKLIEDRTFEIEFIDPEVQAFAFTFG